MNKINIFLKNYFNPKPFYFAFALSVFSVITAYMSSDGLFLMEIQKYGIAVVSLGLIIRIVVGTISTGSIFWVILIFIGKIKGKKR